MDPPETRGTAFLGILKHLRDRYGAPAVAAALEGADPATRQVTARRLHKLQWYPYEAYIGLVQAAVDVFGDGDPVYARTLGEVAADRDLSTVFKLFRRLYGPQRLIRACGRVWNQYYRNAGSMSALNAEPDDTRLRIVDFDGMHPLHCRLMEGWMIGSMRILGAEVAGDGRESACTSRGDPHHEFSCTWTLRSGG
jgi:hypothetical protein